MVEKQNSELFLKGIEEILIVLIFLRMGKMPQILLEIILIFS
jgi:hypothetical protein